MSVLRIRALLATFLLSGCPTRAELVARDLKTLCDFANAQVSQKGLTNESYVDFVTRGQALKLSSLDVVEAWAAFSNAPVEFRYGFIQEAAERNGLKRWSCDSLKKLSLVPGA
ncbi:MAG: hypothetical protein MUC96_19510 [Myxococcaceae bacterium]|jgi:hypothetical protein|nr:hypothetical protein [Myxococcaceae bacterium]